MHVPMCERSIYATTHIALFAEKSQLPMTMIVNHLVRHGLNDLTCREKHGIRNDAARKSQYHLDLAILYI